MNYSAVVYFFFLKRSLQVRGKQEDISARCHVLVSAPQNQRARTSSYTHRCHTEEEGGGADVEDGDVPVPAPAAPTFNRP